MPKPKGASVVKEENDNEAGAKLRNVKRSSSFEEFLGTMKKAEEESIKPLSGDMEVIPNIDIKSSGGKKQLKDLQIAKRLVGWYPKTGVAMVLKEAFLEKKKDNKNKGE